MNDIRKVLTYNDILLCPRNSELEHLNDADIFVGYTNCPLPFRTLPIVNAPMDTICSRELINLLDNNNIVTTIHRWFNKPSEQLDFFKSCNIKNPQNCFLAVGIVDKWKEWIDTLISYSYYNKIEIGILIDVANGDTKSSVNTIKYIREKLPKANIMAGNVATKSGFSRLQDAGANFIRVGIGGGSICSTRLQTGFGVPVLTSILDCAKVKDKAYLIADGGIENNGDICKAIAAGADMVMIGKIFAATNLANNEKLDGSGYFTEDLSKIKYCIYRGMASKESIERLNSKKSSISIEGVSGLIPYRGLTKDVIEEMSGNLRSAMAYYAGCRNWDEFKRKVKIIEITSQGWEESKTRVL